MCTSGRETEPFFGSAQGGLSANAGSWFANDAKGTEVGGKFLSVWRKNADGTLELVLETGIASKEQAVQKGSSDRA